MGEEKKPQVDGAEFILRDRFVDELSVLFKEHFGDCPDKGKLWKFAQAMFVLFTNLALERPVSLRGIGAFMIHQAKPRKNSVQGVDTIPSLKFRPSALLNAMVLNRFGIAVPIPAPDEEEIALVMDSTEAKKPETSPQEFTEARLSRRASADQNFVF